MPYVLIDSFKLTRASAATAKLHVDSEWQLGWVASTAVPLCCQCKLRHS